MSNVGWTGSYEEERKQRDGDGVVDTRGVMAVGADGAARAGACKVSFQGSSTQLLLQEVELRHASLLS